MKSKRDFSDIGMDEVCLACSQLFGRHCGYCCPNPDGYGHIADERFYSVVDDPHDIAKINAASTRPGPRKPAPAIPPEIHATKPFDPVAAWEAVKALSKGS